MNRRGQSIIEYTLIAILVILGIVYMGPYVLRSVNAHFKLWDDSVQDSFQETLNQAPAADIPNINVHCTCTNVDEGCGSSAANSPCPATEHAYAHICNPQGCDYSPTVQCAVDLKHPCCTGTFPLGCGTIPIGQPTTASNCNIGQEILGNQCGTNTSIQCVNGTGAPYNCPMPACAIPDSDNGVATAIACPGATDGLDQNYPNVYVATQASCNSATKCEFYCSASCPLLNGICTCLTCNVNTPIPSDGCQPDFYNNSFHGLCPGGAGKTYLPPIPYHFQWTGPTLVNLKKQTLTTGDIITCYGRNPTCTGSPTCGQQCDSGNCFQGFKTAYDNTTCTWLGDTKNGNSGDCPDCRGYKTCLQMTESCCDAAMNNFEPSSNKYYKYCTDGLLQSSGCVNPPKKS